ncbi:hypothetical protein FPV67DRAFT_1615358 [Lyophyllum atratum]|nr:hypothetical protein FPV67DRAFT_1615358 [Lyophyllum atratum]
MFFCVPIIFGCQTKLKPDGEQQQPRICPRCHNASVIAAKSTTWFELFWVPLIPFSKKHIWLCSICQWSAKVTEPGFVTCNTSFDSTAVLTNDYRQGEPDAGQHPQPSQGLHQNHQAGYAPAYISQGPQKQ